MIDLRTGKAFDAPSAQDALKCITRRKTLAGLAGILATACAPSIGTAASGARRGLGMRCGMMAGSGEGWTNPYVTDGLIAMWDGEWNAGGGIHDPDATKWKDLVFDVDLTLVDGGSFGVNSIESSNKIKGIATSNITDALYSGSYCIEAVFRKNGYTEGSSIIAFDGRRGVYGQGIYSMDNVYPKWFWMCTESPINISGIGYSYGQSSSMTISALDSNLIGYLNSTQKISFRISPTVQLQTSLIIMSNMDNVFCFRIYDKSLTADEIAANYAIDRARFGIT